MSKANYDLPDAKLQQVVRLSGARSKKEALIIAMDEFLKTKRAQELIHFYGKIPLNWSQKSLKNYRG